MKKAFIQLHIAVFLAGFTAILGKLITLNEGLLVWYRLFITVISLWVLLYLKNEFKKLPVKNTVLIFGVGGIVGLFLWKYKIFQCFCFTNLPFCYWIFHFYF